MRDARTDLPEQCPSCGGLGVRAVSHVDAAARVHPNMKADAWRMTWAPRYKGMLREVLRWDSMIEAHLYRKLLQ